jgi:cell division protein FtsB
MKGLRFSLKYALVILGVVFLAYLVMGFNTKMAELRRLSEQKDEVAARATSVALENAHLQAQVTQAVSDQAVMKWAYEDARMVRPGDHPVAPIAPMVSTPQPTPVPVSEYRQIKNWQMWLLLFVDRIEW